jgi:hypothetical protein
LQVTLSPVAVTGWQYDEDRNAYERLQNGAPHELDGPGDLEVANVVFMGVEVEPLEDDLVRIETIGEGPAILLRDGQRWDGRWHKDGADDHIEIRSEDGEVLPLRPGSTWFLLPPAENLP